MKDTRYNREKNVPRMSVSGEVDARFSAFDADDVELVKKAQAGDENALNELLDEKQSLIHKVIAEFSFSSIPADELLAIGNNTLKKSIRIFDPNRGTRFSSFAYWGLKQAFQRADDEIKESSQNTGNFIFAEAFDNACKQANKRSECAEDKPLASTETPGIAQVDCSTSTIFTLADETPQVAHTRPIEFLFLDTKYSVNSWTDFVIEIARLVRHGVRGDLLDEVRPSDIAFTGRLCVSSSPDGMLAPKKIDDTLWIETNFCAKQLVDFAKWLTWWCDVEQKKVIVRYRKKNVEIVNTKLTCKPVVLDSSLTTFSKRLDWSALNAGICFPQQYHSLFLKHLSRMPAPGDSHPVILEYENKRFNARLYLVAFSSGRKPVLQLMYGSQTAPFAVFIRNQFPVEYEQLRIDHKNKKGISHAIRISPAQDTDTFIVSFAKVDENDIDVSSPKINAGDVEKHTAMGSIESDEFLGFKEKCAVLLNESFASGFRLNSPIAVKRFRSFWKDKFSSECDREDDDIQKAMRLVGVEFEERIYAPHQLASQEVFDELKEYVEHLFAEGKPVIYYQALFDEFNRRGTDWKINSPEMLKSFLAANECPYSLRRSCIAIDHDVAVSPISAIRDFLREQQEPVGYDKLYAALPNLPPDVIKHELATNTEFVNAARGEYMHADIVDLSESDLELIADMIRTEIHSKGYMTGTELWGKLEVEFPEYTDRYSHLPLVGFRDALKHKFFGQFNFQGNIISSVDEPIRMADIFAGFCRRRSSFTLADLDRLRADADAPVIYFEPVYENSVRISQDDFVSPESVSFDVDAVDEAISRFCNGEFIAIVDITSFAAFPVMGVQWTSYLVEAFVSKYSKKYKLLHNQYNATVCAGAILRADAKLYDYSQVLAVVLAKANCELDSTAALDYLCNAGFLGRRRYTDIAIVLSEARQIRSRKR